MRLEHQITHPRLLRKPARGDRATGGGLVGEVDGRKTSRFVDATLLDQERKAAIIQALAERQIGDEVGREIFVGAVEYQLTAFAHHLGRAATGSAKRDRALGAVADQVQAFSALLAHLPEGLRIWSDRFYEHRTLTMGTFEHGITEGFPCAQGPELLLHVLTLGIEKEITNGTISILPSHNTNFLGVAKCDDAFTEVRANSFKAIINPAE